MVEVQPGVKIRTAVFNPPTESEENTTSEKYPVVMVHGFGGGLGLFVKNFDSVSERVPLYAFDLLGFGRSTRVEFSSDPQVAEQQFIDSIEQWRKKVGLRQFVLLGHSFGAYLSCSYAIKHPESVRHLVLVDPWGFAERTDADVERQRSYPWYVRSIASVVGKFNPLSGLRAAGPLGECAGVCTERTYTVLTYVCMYMCTYMFHLICMCAYHLHADVSTYVCQCMHV